MKRPTLPPSDPLLRLLDEWQPQPKASADFDRRLHRRIAHTPTPSPFSRAWWATLGRVSRPGWAVVSMAFLAVMGVFFLLRAGSPAPPSLAPAPSVQIAQADPVVRDLQTLDRDGDLLENLDFLSVPGDKSISTAPPHLQDQE